VFGQQGYAATSLDDLTDALGIGRSSFYSAFGSKRDLLIAALRLYCAETNARLALARAGAESPAAAVFDVVRTMVDPDGGRQGCFMLNCQAEVAFADPEVDSITRAQLDGMRRLIAEVLRAAGQAHSDAEADRILVHVLGLVMLRKFGVSAAEIDGHIREILLTIA
jgi:TetR/AcrR family transcriptional regulator, transcriptional repressor for nem operon